MELKEKMISSYIAQQEKSTSINRYVHQLRNESITTFEKKGFPTLKNEEWKYTNLMPLLKHDYSLFSSETNSIEYKDIRPFLLDDLDSYRLVFVNGVYSAWLSQTTHQDKDICALSHVLSLQKYGSVIENYYGKISSKEDSLSALNTAFAQEGAYIYIPRNILVEKPIQILYLSLGDSPYKMMHPRNLIVVQENSHVQIIERHQCLGEHSVLTNSLTEIYLSDNSQVEYTKIQQDTPEASLIDHTFISQSRGSNCNLNTFSFEGKFIRNNLNFYQKGEGINSVLNGLTILNKEQLVDHHTLVDHFSPHCQSHQLYKGIFGGGSKGVFSGKIMVHKEAQKLNAFQQNNNLILSQEASVNAKPQLEIFADDVKCSHGCTVGQLSSSALFYLRSRGIPEKEAKALLLFTFAWELLERIKIPQLKNRIHKMIGRKLDVKLDFGL